MVAETVSAAVNEVETSLPATNIDWKIPARWLLLSLLLPVALAVVSDVSLGTLPMLTLVVSLVCIPLATVLVMRATMTEFNRVIEIVAPAVADDNGAATDEASNTGNIRPDASA